MVFRSDVEEIEIDADPPEFYDDDDSNSNSNFSDASSRQDRRSSRARSSKGTFLKGTVDETSQSSAGSSTRPGRPTKNSKKYISQLSSKELKERELTEFLGDDFDLSSSRRKKQVDYSDNIYNTNKNKRGAGRPKQNSIYDEKGILVHAKKDLCDCMDDTCPGCHFPCPKCRSNKCGHECRQNRKWMFLSVEVDGFPGSTKENPYAKELETILASKK